MRLDGTVGLGIWGSVAVTGLTLEQAAEAIRKHMAKFKFEKVTRGNLVVIVDVVAYNSKRYYVITDGGGFGEQVYPFPITGSETVLDAIANVRACRTWRASGTSGSPGGRRTPASRGRFCRWTGSASRSTGSRTTNYQMMPGDRIYVSRKAQ